MASDSPIGRDTDSQLSHLSTICEWKTQDIQPKSPIAPLEIVSEGGKGNLNPYISNYVGLQMA